MAQEHLSTYQVRGKLKILYALLDQGLLLIAPDTLCLHQKRRLLISLILFEPLFFLYCHFLIEKVFSYLFEPLPKGPFSFNNYFLCQFYGFCSSFCSTTFVLQLGLNHFLFYWFLFYRLFIYNLLFFLTIAGVATVVGAILSTFSPYSEMSLDELSNWKYYRYINVRIIMSL